MENQEGDDFIMQDMPDVEMYGLVNGRVIINLDFTVPMGLTRDGAQGFFLERRDFVLEHVGLRYANSLQLPLEPLIGPQPPEIGELYIEGGVQRIRVAIGLPPQIAVPDATALADQRYEIIVAGLVARYEAAAGGDQNQMVGVGGGEGGDVIAAAGDAGGGEGGAGVLIAAGGGYRRRSSRLTGFVVYITPEEEEAVFGDVVYVTPEEEDAEFGDV